MAPSHSGGSPGAEPAPEQQRQNVRRAGTGRVERGVRPDEAAGPGARIRRRPPRQPDQQRQPERDADPADLARRAAQGDGAERARARTARSITDGLEGRQHDEHDPGAPAAAPGLERPDPAQHQARTAGDQQREPDGEDAQTASRPWLVPPSSTGSSAYVPREPQPQPPVDDERGGDRVDGEQRERDDAAEQQRGEPLRLAEREGRAERRSRPATGGEVSPGAPGIGCQTADHRSPSESYAGSSAGRGERAGPEQPAGRRRGGPSTATANSDHDRAQPRVPRPLVGDRAELVGGQLVDRGGVDLAGDRDVALGERRR